jgi:hypothetical protein
MAYCNEEIPGTKIIREFRRYAIREFTERFDTAMDDVFGKFVEDEEAPFIRLDTSVSRVMTSC